MILIISTCKEKLHEPEFVRPIEDILKKGGIKFTTKHYNKLSSSDISSADKIIITGTSLKDNYFLQDLNKFEWILYTKKPILGICAGMQIIGFIFNGKLGKKKEIGMTQIKFSKEFLGMKEEKEVYELHNNYVVFRDIKNFEIFARTSIAQAVKHKSKPVYGVLFHPEIRNKEIIINFINLN
jgi:GMP synthase (glutamine-hydrolysing)